jgi:CMP-N,N'-diacetyllegionaminic acid synthase
MSSAPPITLAVIPARGGSKSVPGKNIRPLGGKPLIAHSIAQALACPQVDRVLVTTDSEEIRQVALDHGAEAPFLRPSELAGDTTPDQPVFRHVLQWLADTEGYRPDLVLNLRPTAPFRAVEDITAAIMRWDAVRCDAVRSVTRVEGVHHPYWMFAVDDKGMARPFVEGIGDPMKTYYQRQLLPPAFRLNGVVDGMTPLCIFGDSLYGERIVTVEIPELRAHDIDTAEDFAHAEYLMAQKQAL